MNWTNDQKNAIEKKGSNILVAAAAGSGKTAVLVERIIQKIIIDKVDIDKILIVTFTNAAASEMREKILDALYKKIEECPNDLNLQKQIILLKKANICTIHAFCLSIIKNNFFEIDLTSNFRISTEEEIELLKQDCLEDLFDKYYEMENEEFNNLLEIYTGYKDDIRLKDLILRIHTFIQSMPFPIEWLDQNISKFHQDKEKDFSESIWGKILLDDFFQNLEYVITILEQAKKILEPHMELEKYSNLIKNDVNSVKQIKYIEDKTWDKLLERIENLRFERWISDRKIVNLAKEEAKKLRDIAKKKIEDIKNKTFLFTSKEAWEDTEYMYPIFQSLRNLICEFDIEFKKVKKEKNIIDFNDIEHYALNILVKKVEDKYIPTDIAKRYIEKFEEIAVDEYQDSNQVQEYILSTISNGRNMFMVGDVKQSIYKFRQACPDLFLDKYRKFGLNDKNDFGLKIPLFKNFRSRENIVNIVNAVFESIMSDQLGDNINYTEEEFLNKGAEYEELNDQSEICVIDLKIEEDDELKENNNENFLEKEEIEAKFVANKIEELIQNKVQVTDKHTRKLRNIEYRDIVILLRSTSYLSPIYEQELLNRNISVYSESSSKYLDTIEIQSIICLLKIIDNPINDIALVSVLRGPIYSFTDNEILEIRINHTDKNFYYNLLDVENSKISTNLSKKVENFMHDLMEFRKYSKYASISELIWRIYIKTGFFDYVLFMPNGNVRQANLKMLFERAKEFEKSSYKGLYKFIKFIENLKNHNKDFSAAKVIGENENVVRIMSIHKSKGLEFPYVFLSSTSKKINLKDLSDLVLLHQEIGLGPEYIDPKRKIQYSTAAKLAMQLKIREEAIAEEMRILYVALTRAKDKLIITGTVNHYEKDLQKKNDDLNIYSTDLKINKLLMKKYISYYDWIHLVYLKNSKLSQEVKFEVFNRNFVISKDVQCKEEKTSPQLKEKIDIDKIEKIIDWKYEFIKSTFIPIKTSVSQLKQKDDNVQLYSKESIDLTKTVPQFANEKNTTGARIGTIMHNLLQEIDFKIDYDIDELAKIINHLILTKKINEEEAKLIDLNKILKFLNSNIGRQIKNAKQIYKEIPFCTKIYANEYFDASEEEYILVQGIIDLYFIDEQDNIYIVDYKTDVEFNENKLKQKYEKQLELYATALEKKFNKKIYKKYLYSLFLNKEIEI